MDSKSSGDVVTITVGCSDVCAEEAGYDSGSNALIHVSTIQEAASLLLRSLVRKNFSLWNSELCKIALELCLAKSDTTVSF